jgi:lysylphosphatidylglycerol synthetase-like protein (DUF2156 family)
MQNREQLIDLVEKFGGPLSTVVFDETCELFTVRGIDGVIPFRRGIGSYVVGLGDPVCAPESVRRLLEAFGSTFRTTIFAAASRRVVRLASHLGFASIEFGEELSIDPRCGLPRGRRAHGLRRKLNHARSGGVAVVEYRPGHIVDGALETALEGVVKSWLAGLHGLQAYAAHIDLFRPRALRRWFYAKQHGEVIGLAKLVHLEARQGWLVENLVTVPTAPVGTSELLVASVLEVLAEEGCPSASFGTSTARTLGAIDGLPKMSAWIGRRFFHWAQHAFHIESVGDYRRKFGDVRGQPMYLLFNPPRVGALELFALVRAFNVVPAARAARARIAARSPDTVEGSPIVAPQLVP